MTFDQRVSACQMSGCLTQILHRIGKRPKIRNSSTNTQRLVLGICKMLHSTRSWPSIFWNPTSHLWSGYKFNQWSAIWRLFFALFHNLCHPTFYFGSKDGTRQARPLFDYYFFYHFFYYGHLSDWWNRISCQQSLHCNSNSQMYTLRCSYSHVPRPDCFAGKWVLKWNVVQLNYQFSGHHCMQHICKLQLPTTTVQSNHKPDLPKFDYRRL